MKSVLAPIDASPATVRVMEVAADLATAVGGRVDLFHAMPAAGTAEEIKIHGRAADERLAEFKRQLEARGLAVTTECVVGRPGESIIKQVRKYASSYVVLGWDGRTDMNDLLGGTISTVLREVWCPVVLVPLARQMMTAAPSTRAPARAHAVITILVPVDLSPVTERLLKEAVTLTRHFDGHMLLLNVTRPDSIAADHLAFEETIGNFDHVVAEAESGDVPLAEVRGDSLQLVGDPVDVIVDQAARLPADYIVMGSHGHSVLHELVLGSTTSGVVQLVECPVIIVPARAEKMFDRVRRSVSHWRI